jgi:hypothetical protein
MNVIYVTPPNEQSMKDGYEEERRYVENIHPDEILTNLLIGRTLQLEIK